MILFNSKVVVISINKAHGSAIARFRFIMEKIQKKWPAISDITFSWSLSLLKIEEFWWFSTTANFPYYALHLGTIDYSLMASWTTDGNGNGAVQRPALENKNQIS